MTKPNVTVTLAGTLDAEDVQRLVLAAGRKTIDVHLAQNEDGDDVHELVDLRLGTPSDASAILQLLVVMHAENGEEPIDFDKLRYVIRTRLEGGNAFVTVINGKIVGSIGLYENALWYSDVRHLGDYWTFVHPDYRGGDIARKLIRAARGLAAKRGLSLYLGIRTPIKIEKKMKFYERQGLHLIGALYMEGD